MTTVSWSAGVEGATPATVALDSLRVGELLAEGGEGRVFELPRQPHLVYKAYRQTVARAHLDDLLAWPGRIGRPDLVERVRSATAWPESVVVGPGVGGGLGIVGPEVAGGFGPAGGHGPGAGVGVLMPRAPRRFALRHRDGTTRLASLSYLTADPAYRAVAYGLSLPPPVGAERIGLVYALARLLEAFESVDPSVAHGDLSAKNVLWSLRRGPEIFVLDCDNCERYGPDGTVVEGSGPGGAGRRRPMTPNWDDPAVPAGANATVHSDRYSLALIFLRVVGAANFPIQARQRRDGSLHIDFAVPPERSTPLLGPGAPIWELCEKGLSLAAPGSRPPATQWVGALEAVLDAIGAASVMRAVWDNQGGGRPAAAPPARDRSGPGALAGDVTITPLVARAHRPVPRWTVVTHDLRDPNTAARPGFGPGYTTAGSPAPAGIPSAAVGAGAPPAQSSRTPGVTLGRVAAAPILPQLLGHLRRGIRWLIATHRRMAHELLAGGARRDGLRTLALCLAVDLVGLLGGLFIVAMIVAPVLGI